MTHELSDIAEKVDHGERLSAADGLTLLRTRDLWTLGELADSVRRRKHGDVAYYNVNRHLNYSNVCALSCKFCEFHRKRGQAGAYEHDLPRIQAEARAAAEAGATEMHIVGGLHPFLPFSYYTDMLAGIKEVAPRPAPQGVHGRGNRPPRPHLQAAPRPGSGADGPHRRRPGQPPGGRSGGVRRPRARRGVQGQDPQRPMARRAPHRPPPGPDDQRDHALRPRRNPRRPHPPLRAAPRSTGRGARGRTRRFVAPRASLLSVGVFRGWGGGGGGGGGRFQTIIPLPFIPDGSELQHLPGPTGLENLRMLAVARLMLDNFDHVKCFWIMQTLPMAELSLNFGADDVDGTVVWYDITKVNGTSTHQEVTTRDLRKAITDAGFRPVERDTLYRPVERDGANWRVNSPGLARGRQRQRDWTAGEPAAM